MRKTVILPPGAYMKLVAAVFPLFLAFSGGEVLRLYATMGARPLLLAAPLLPYGALLLAAGVYDLLAVAGIVAAYLRHWGPLASRKAFCPRAGADKAHILGQSHELTDVLQFLLFLILGFAALGWAMALEGYLEQPARVRAFVALTLISTLGLILYWGASYVYRWAWSGNAFLRLAEIPVLTGRVFSGHIVSRTPHPPGWDITVTMRCKHGFRRGKTWRASCTCRPVPIREAGWAARFSFDLPRGLGSATNFGVSWSLFARVPPAGPIPEFFCIFTDLPVFEDPAPPSAPDLDAPNETQAHDACVAGENP